MTVTIASTHSAYPRMDGQAELTWMVNEIPRRCECDSNPRTITHPSIYKADYDYQSANYLGWGFAHNKIIGDRYPLAICSLRYAYSDLHQTNAVQAKRADLCRILFLNRVAARVLFRPVPQHVIRIGSTVIYHRNQSDAEVDAQTVDVEEAEKCHESQHKTAAWEFYNNKASL